MSDEPNAIAESLNFDLDKDTPALFVFVDNDTDTHPIFSAAQKNNLKGGWNTDTLLIFIGDQNALEEAATELQQLDYTAAITTYTELSNLNNEPILHMNNLEDSILELYIIPEEELSIAERSPAKDDVTLSFTDAAAQNPSVNSALEKIIPGLSDDFKITPINEDDTRIYFHGTKDAIQRASESVQNFATRIISCETFAQKSLPMQGSSFDDEIETLVRH